MTAEFLLLRLDAPLVSFGGPVVDNLGIVDRFPGLSLLTGLLANALGYDHRDVDKLKRLQERLCFATRCDRSGDALVDFQIADLGQDFLLAQEVGWTTWGNVDERKGGAAATGTHIRYRHYRADSIHTVALTLLPSEKPPTIDDLKLALEEPERPLFIGRKCCLPATPLLLKTVKAPSPISALRLEERISPSRTGVASNQVLPACWTQEIPGEASAIEAANAHLVQTTDRRDWASQLHCGRRHVLHGSIDPPEEPHE